MTPPPSSSPDSGSPGLHEYYETDRLLSEYLLLHYGHPADVLPYPFGPDNALHFPVRCVSECLDFNRLPHGARALDVGCAVGRATFELSRYCESAIGIDSSRHFVRAALEIKRHGLAGFDRNDEGFLTERCVARLPEGLDLSKVHFELGDAMNLHADLVGFDVVLAANLICRLPEPEKFLDRVPRLVKRGGQLILTTPCSWLEAFTHHKKWIGGYTTPDGDPVRTIDGLHNFLDDHFELVNTLNLPFLIREHSRKYQWNVALATVWARY